MDTVLLTLNFVVQTQTFKKGKKYMKRSLTAKIITVVVLGTASIAFGAEKAKMTHNMDNMKHMEMTAEQRQSMAAAHEKMASCLRSDKSMEDCKMEMMSSCKESMGKESCSMMGDMDGMKGKMKHHKKMDDNEASK